MYIVFDQRDRSAEGRAFADQAWERFYDELDAVMGVSHGRRVARAGRTGMTTGASYEASSADRNDDGAIESDRPAGAA